MPIKSNLHFSKKIKRENLYKEYYIKKLIIILQNLIWVILLAKFPGKKFLLLFFIFSLALICIDNFQFFKKSEYLYTRNNGSFIFLKFLFYIGLYLTNSFSLFVLLIEPRFKINYVTKTILFFGVFLNFTLVQINGIGLTIHETLIFFREISFFDDAVIQYIKPIIFSLIISSAFLISFVYLKRKFLSEIKPKLFFHLIHLVIPVSLFVVNWSGGRITEFPSPYKNLYLPAYASTLQLEFYGERKKTVVEPSEKSEINHLILIVDESIRGDYLSLNNYEIKTTPFLDSIKNQLVNFGIINAPANYSSASNVIFQTGIKPDQLPDVSFESLKTANIFQYAKKAGYKNILIDNQVFDSYNNFLTQFDIDKIDYYLPLKEMKPEHNDWMLDTAAVNLLDKTISDCEKSFTYFVKSGSHFPYLLNTAPDCKIPELSSKESLTDKEEYLISVKWSVDKFFRHFFGKFSKLEKYLVIYLSDHAQSFKEDGDIVTGHSTVENPPISQIKIPMFCFTDIPLPEEKLTQISEEKFSSFSVFPFTLNFMGYNSSDLIENFYPVQNKTEFERFISGDIFNRGNTFKWNSINSKDTVISN